jgi:hypothetical protein
MGINLSNNTWNKRGILNGTLEYQLNIVDIKLP